MNRWLDKFALPLGLVLIASLLVSAYFIIQKTTSQDTTDQPDQPIVIDVAGAVHQPGVYRFDAEAIVEDAINQAGGITDSADLGLIAKTINRAAPLNDHDKVYIPSTNSDVHGPDLNSLASTVSSATNLININTADGRLLDTLPGIGPITADRIIDYRDQRGRFLKLEDLMKVEGISFSKYNRLRDLITI